MLAAYDIGHVLADSHEVITYHGTVAEEEFRQWLIRFLPARYGVTAGYVVSSYESEKAPLPHYDVIIFDRLESPVLWVEGRDGTDRIIQSRAIPVENVKAVIEVKSSLDTRTARKAIEHLADLSRLYEGVDRAGPNYKQFLPEDFICLLVFFELRPNTSQLDKNKAGAARRAIKNALDQLREAEKLKGYRGSLVLHGAGQPCLETARPTWVSASLPDAPSTVDSHPFFSEADVDKADVLSNQLKLDDGSAWKLLMAWYEDGFAHFAFDLLAMLQGTYEPRWLSSSYGSASTPLPRNVLRVPTNIKPFLHKQVHLDHGSARQ